MKKYLLNLITSLLLAYYLAVFITSHRLPGISLFTLLASFVTINFLALIFTFLPLRGIIKSAFQAAFLVFANLLFSYHYNVKSSLDFAVIADNYEESFTPESFSVILSSVSWLAILLSFCLAAIFLYAQKRMKSPHCDTKNITSFGGVLVIYIVLVFLPFDTYDDVTYLLKSAIARTGDSYAFDASREAIGFYKDAINLTDKSAFIIDGDKRPHIFILMLESFNAGVLEKNNENGEEITPNFNRLIKSGLYVERFYGNSIQTSKGHFAVYSSILPSIRGKVFRHFPGLKFSSLPAMLSQIGYETLFFQAHKDVHYDNTHDFLVNNGFQSVLSAASFRKAEEDDAEWGIADGDFYKIIFEYLDRNNVQKPQFISLATIANHMRFDNLPQEKRSLYKQPRSINEDYANSIHLSDTHLKIFFDELSKREYLENSLVIITGDHSFPVGGHGISHNEAGFYDESFRTPFLMLWKNRIIPQRIKHAPFSQMDIAPSVLDLLNVAEMANTFEGVSIFSKDRKKPIYLVQPYSGRYVAVVDYPLKLVKHLRSGKEYLFNLAEDPEEEINLIDKSAADLIEIMRNKLSYVFLSQRLLESNNIYGGSGELPRQREAVKNTGRDAEL